MTATSGLPISPLDCTDSGANGTCMTIPCPESLRLVHPQQDKDALLRAYVGELSSHSGPGAGSGCHGRPPIAGALRLPRRLVSSDTSARSAGISGRRWEKQAPQIFGRPIPWEARSTPSFSPAYSTPGRTARASRRARDCHVTHATWMLDADLFVHGSNADGARECSARRADARLHTLLPGMATRSKQGWFRNHHRAGRKSRRGPDVLRVAGRSGSDGREWKDSRTRKRSLAAANELLPGKTAEWSISLSALPATAKTVLIRIANPMPGGHPVAFANAEMSTVLARMVDVDP
jgi:hypothetical protein